MQATRQRDSDPFTKKGCMNMDGEEIYWTLKKKKKTRREIHHVKNNYSSRHEENKGYRHHIIFISKKKNRHHPSLGSVMPHAAANGDEPELYIQDLSDHIASHCIADQRYVKKMAKRKYRKKRNTYRPNIGKLLHTKQPTFLPHVHDSVTASCVTSCGDWFVILDPARKYECFLWNCVSYQKIQLPRLLVKKDFYKCILTAPPTERRHCQVLFFFNLNKQLILYCGVGCKRWTVLPYVSEDIDDFYSQAICCNGKVYAARPDLNLLYEIPITRRYIKVDISYPSCAQGGGENVDIVVGLEKQHLVESRGEVFLVQRFSVSRIEVYRMDFSRDEWVRVHSLGDDRVFFLNCNHSVSLTTKETGIEEGNCIYFTNQASRSLYVFNLGDKSLSVSKNCPNSGALWLTWEGKLPVLRLEDNNSASEQKLDGLEEEKKKKAVDMVNADEGEADSSNIFELVPMGVLGKIGQSLGAGSDYTNFRLVCTRWSLAAPPYRWRRDSTASCHLMQYPWLLFFSSSSSSKQKEEEMCSNFYDPRQHLTYHQKKSPDLSAADCVIRYSSEDGWLLCSQGDKTLFLFQQLTQKRIDLPDWPWENARGFCFSGSPGSSDLEVVGIAQVEPEMSVVFYLCSISKSWIGFEEPEFIPSQSNPVFLNGMFYFLSQDGFLGELQLTPNQEEEYLWSVFDDTKLQFPSTVCQSFLVSVNNKAQPQLFSVVVGSLGKWIRVYRFGWRGLKWFKRNSLDDGTVFISDSKSIYLGAEETVAAMKNKIYFPRFSTTKGSPRILNYSMEARRFGTSEEDDYVGRDFYGTKEVLNCTWFRDGVIPSF